MAQHLKRVRSALLILVLSCATPALAEGHNGFGVIAGLGAAGGGQVGSSPALALGVELGAHLDSRGLFVGAFGDRFTDSLWDAGISAKEYFGSSRLLWAGIKVSLSGMAGMVGSSAAVKTWDNYLNGGLGVGMRIPVSATMNLQPFAEVDSFIPILGTTRVSTGPGESSVKFVTGSRCTIPTAGIRFAIEL